MRKQSLILIYSTSNLLSESNNSILTRGYSLYPFIFFCGKNHATQAHKKFTQEPTKALQSSANLVLNFGLLCSEEEGMH